MAGKYRHTQQTMVLTEADNNRLLFQFHGKKRALITGAMGVWMLAAAVFLWWQNGFDSYLAGFGAFAAVLAAAAVFSAKTVRGMEIDKRRGSVRYAEKTLNRNEIWEKPFSDFVSISVHYLRNHSDSKRRPLIVEIVSRAGGYYRIGTDAAGAGRETAARELADRIGGIMGIPVVASIGKS